MDPVDPKRADLRRTQNNQDSPNSDLLRRISELEKLNAQLEQMMLGVAEENERLSGELSNFKGEVAVRRRQDRELRSVQDQLTKMTNTAKAKTDEILKLKQSEENLIQDNTKLYKQILASMEQSDTNGGGKFEELKKVLKDVLSNDDGFCSNLGATNSDDDDDVFRVIQCILRDYVSTKKLYFNEFRDWNSKLKRLQEDKESLGTSVAAMTKKIRLQNEANKKFEREIAQHKKDGHEIVAAMKLKDEQIKDLEQDLKRTKESKAVAAGGQQKNQAEVKKYQICFKSLREELKLKTGSEMAKLRKDIETREKDCLDTIQMYSSGLEELKLKV